MSCDCKCHRKVVSTDKAPKAIGPYSQAICVNGLVFVSGQIPIDPATSQLLPATSTITQQTALVMSNLRNILEAAGSSLDKVVKTTCYLRDMNDFAEFNAEYAKSFPANPPARGCVQVARLPKDVGVEVEAIASL